MAKRIIVIAFIALLTLSLSHYDVSAAVLAKIKVEKEVTFRQGYIVVNTLVEVLNGDSDIWSFKLPSDYREKLIYVAAIIGGEIVPVKVAWNSFIVTFSKPYPKFKIIEIYKLDMKFEERTVKISFPLIITPREAIGDAYIRVKTPVKDYAIESPAYLNKTDVGAVANLTLASPGETDIVSLTFYQVDLAWFSIPKLNRTVIIESTDEATFIDEYIIANGVGGRLEYVNLELPLNATIKRLEGFIGPYTGRGGDGAFHTWKEDNKTMVSISLRSPLLRRGEKEYLKVVYSVPIKTEDNILEIPAYHSSGLLIENYEIVIKITGDGELVDLTPRFVKFVEDYKVIGLQHKGVLLDDIPSGNPYVKLKVSLNLSVKMRPYIILGAFSLILALIAVAFVQRARAVKIEAKKAVKIEAPEELVKELRDLYVEKTRLYEALVEAKVGKLTAKISRQVYRQKVARISSKRKNLDRRIAELKNKIGKVPLLEEVEKIFHEIEMEMGKFEDINTRYRRGEMSKRAFKEEIENLKEKIERKTSKIHSRLSALEIE